MKLLRGQCFGLLILLNAVLPLQGMVLSPRTYQRFNRLKSMQPVAMQPKQSWGGWLSSWTQPYISRFYGSSAALEPASVQQTLNDFEEQPLRIATVVHEPVKSAVELESEDIIKQLYETAWYKDNILADKIRMFFEKNSIEDIEKVFFALLSEGNSFYGAKLLGHLSKQNMILSAKIDQLKPRWFEKIDFGGPNTGDILFDQGGLVVQLLPVNTEGFIGIVEKALKALALGLPSREGYRATNIMDYSQRLRRFLIVEIVNKIISEQNEQKKEKLCVILLENCSRIEFGGTGIKDILKKNLDVVKTIVSVFEKNRSHKDFTLGHDFAMLLLDIAFTSNPLLADVIETIIGIDSSCAQTPSYRHLQRYYSHLSHGLDLKAIANNPNIKGMIQKSVLKEKELIEQGNEVFYHARRWQYGFLSDLYSMLYEYKSGKELKDFIFTHLDDPVLEKASERFYASEQAKRELLLKEGNPFSHESKTNPVGIARRQSLLFLNKFLFGNLDRLGSCSMAYVLRNHNMGEIDFSVQEIFNMFGQYDAYQKFENELQNLQQEYNSLTQYGEMLQIAMPKDNVDKSVYYTTSGGPRKEFVLKTILRGGEGIASTSETITTTDIKTILQDIDKIPVDVCEFVLVNTRDKFGGLNPESGIKVFSYNAVDPATMAAFKEKESALFGKIIQWMQQQNIQKERAQRARE